MPSVDSVAKAIDPTAWNASTWDYDGTDLTPQRRKTARAAARRVMALFAASDHASSDNALSQLSQNKEKQRQ